VKTDNFEFVDSAFAKLRHEQFPDAGRTTKAHGIDAAIPAIEIADQADATSVGSPDGKMNAGDAVNGLYMRAKLFVGVVMATLAHEVEIEFGKKKGERVGVVIFMNFAILGAKTDAIAGRSRSEFAGAGEHSFKEAFRAKLAHGKRLRNAGVWQGFGGQAAQKELRFDGARLEEAHSPTASLGRFERVRAENTERIGIASHEKGIQTRTKLLRSWKFWVRHDSILSEERRRTNEIGEKSSAEKQFGAG
jgi:hypothetical protein